MEKKGRASRLRDWAEHEDVPDRLARILLEQNTRARQTEEASDSQLSVGFVGRELPEEARLEDRNEALENRFDELAQRTENIEDKLTRRMQVIEEKTDLVLQNLRGIESSFQLAPTHERLRQALEVILEALRRSPVLISARVYSLRTDLLNSGAGPPAIVVIEDSSDYFEKALAYATILDKLSLEGYVVDDILLFRRCEIAESRLKSDYEEVS